MQMNASSLRRQAKDLLAEHGCSPKKLVLLHTAVSLGATLLTTTIGFLLSREIAGTGGLGGMATRSILSTIQSVLELAVIILLPFWEVGILRAALNWRKGENAGIFSLTEGFRRFGSVFAVRFWSGALYIAVGFAIFYASLFLFLMTPWARPIMEQFQPLLEAGTPEKLQEMLTPELAIQMTGNMIPMFILFGLLLAAVCIPLFYRMRFADFFVMEGDGGVKAIVKSFQLTRGNCLQVLKLDLRFWWFYLLQVLSVAVSYGDGILSAMGVTLSFGPDGNFFLFYILGIGMQTVLFWQYNSEKLTAYCLAFDTLASPAPSEFSQEI